MRDTTALNSGQQRALQALGDQDCICSGRHSRASSASGCVGGMLSVRALEAPTDAPRAKHEDAKDGGTVAVGDSALTAPVPLERTPFAGASIAVDVPPQPVPGQTRPNASGRCPRSLIPINGGCWKKLALDPKDCPEGDVVYQGACYTPAYPPARPPTSSPAERTDD